MLERVFIASIVLTMVSIIINADDKRITIPKDTLPKRLNIEHVPLGLDVRKIPKDNRLTEERVRLGRKLFFDPILSANRSIACVTCHDPNRGFAGPATGAIGILGSRTIRKAPSIFNRAYGITFFWDGRESTLEGQALRPISDPSEMGANLDEIVKRLKTDPEYKNLFEKSFKDGVNSTNLGKALASFERVLLRGDSPVDRFRVQGVRSALTDTERHGLWLYESKGLCWQCHSGFNFTDEKFHNTGVSWGKSNGDLGRFVVTKSETDRGKFKTPTLRGVNLTAPYMHDGSLATLEEVIEFYNQGGGAKGNPQLDKTLKPLSLSKDEINALVAFLKAL